MDQFAFIHLLAPSAISIAKRTGLLASGSISLAALTSRWGEDCPGFNLYGIEADSAWKGLIHTRLIEEIINNKPIAVSKKFKAYRNSDESMEDMAKIATLPNFRLDPTVVKQLAEIVAEYNLKQFDL